MIQVGFVRYLRVVTAIAKITFFEIMRDKILYGAFLISLLLLAVSMSAGQLSFVRPDRLVLDFGVSAISLSSVLLSILLSCVAIPKEFERRTIYIALSRPITRFEFLVGKYLGVLAVLSLSGAILSICFLLIVKMAGGVVHFILLKAMLLLWLQAAAISAVGFFFSTFTTTSLSVMMSLGVFMIGVNISQMLFVAEKSGSDFLKRASMIFSKAIPNFETFNLGFVITYDLPYSWDRFMGSILYGMVWVLIFLMMGGFLIEKKE